MSLPAITFSTSDNIKHLNQGFRKTASWNRYRYEIRTELKDNNLHCIIDPTFKNFKRLFVLSF